MAISVWTVVLAGLVFLFYFWLPEIAPRFYRSTRTWAFLLYILVPAFWLVLISDLYLSKWTDVLLRQGIDFRLSSNVFWVWENLPVSQHHWLPFLDKNDLTKSYSSGGMFAYLFLYAVAKGMAWMTNTGLEKAQFMLAYLYAFCQASVVGLSLQKLTATDRLDRRQRFSYFYLVSFFCLLPGTWITTYYFNPDNFFPIVGMYVFYWAVCLYKEAYLQRGWFGALLLLSVVTPLFAILLGALTFAYIYFSENISSRTAKIVYVRVTIVVVISVACYLAAKLVIKYYDLQDTGSSLSYRSGLDGNTAYFKNLIDSVIVPVNLQSLSFRMNSEFVTMVVVLFVAYLCAREIKDEPWHRLFLISIAFYLFQLVLFPQSVKVHPYLYDVSLTIPVLGTCFYIFLRPAFVTTLSASGFLFYNILMLALVLSNLLMLAKATIVIFI